MDTPEELQPFRWQCPYCGGMNVSGEEPFGIDCVCIYCGRYYKEEND